MRPRILILICLLPLSLWSQSITQMQFRDQPIEDILLTLAEISGQSIIADETVTGSATYFFNDMTLDDALDQFLTHYGYFYQKRGQTYHVSRVQTGQSEEGIISLRAEDTDIQYVIRYLSRDLGITILHDALPREKVTINYQNGELEELLEIIIKPFPSFFLEKGDNYFYLRKESVTTTIGSGSTKNYFKRDGDLYSANFRQIRFKEAVASLMAMEEREFSFLGRNDNVIEFFNFQGHSFDEILDLLMEQGNGTYQLSGDIYYVMDRDRQDILKQYTSTIYIPLENISVDRLSAIMPHALSSSSYLRQDTENNGILLNGTLQAIAPIEEFIKQVDKPLRDQQYERFDLNFITVEEFQKRLASEMKGFPIIPLGETSFLTALSPAKKVELIDYLTIVDKGESVYPISLSYLKWDELSENLPPSVTAEQVHSSGNSSLIFFQGSQGQYELFLDNLSQMDVPHSQIRYEVLVLQVEDTQGLNLDANISFQEGTSTGFSGSLNGLASLSFDVVTQFGYQFAASLSVNLTQNRSRVLVDTTLHGLSGETLRFQNTNTSRHSTTTIDADTGESEVTGFKEITSGLIIDMEGWVSGDNMITMEVQSTISSETDSSSDDGDSIPTTSEKIISTHVRTQSGEAIILSGLKQRETVEEISKVPFLGDIPLLGLLFQNRTETLKNSEFLITLIPYREEDVSGSENPYSDMYNQFCVRLEK